MKQIRNNFAFIDSQNLYRGVKKLGWDLDYRKFRVYLEEKYGISVAYLFIGFVALNQDLYDRLQKAGFVLVFKPTIPDADGNIKGNVDADMVLRAVVEIEKYDQALIVTSDGDFYSLVKHLSDLNKLLAVMSPDLDNCSSLLKQTAQSKLYFMDKLRGKLEYIKKHRLRTEP